MVKPELIPQLADIIKTNLLPLHSQLLVSMGQYTGVDGATNDMVELLAAQTHIWKYGLGFVHSMCLKCALELGIPDAIHNHGGPMMLNELLAAVAVQPLKADPLRRIMRVLVHSNFFELCKIPAGGDDEEEEVAYALNSASKHLLENHPLGLRRCILGLMEPGQFRTLGSLSSWFCNGDPTPYETAHGRSGWERLAGDPEYDLGFNATMASDSQMVAAIVLDKCKSIFEGLVSLVDVAGGTGTMAKAIAGAFPDMECTVMDLPHVVANLQGTKNLKFVAGDMFKKIPSANALMLKVTTSLQFKRSTLPNESNMIY